ncbi:sp110 nuclear body protein-like isoform X2 [Danio aesculapii]|uniref:sp110 nuclear body protein-like isoform X2 n=1 Tax=Danio aesculapii TaxID=1142201 RepID=UPI0024BF8840|nr:sp110 nuclear body protein-like isoform X2 [Danio aesculapii]
MEFNGQMDFLTDEQLLSVFHLKKTEISCIEQPLIFLTQLRDHNLLPETRLKKVKGMRTREQRQQGVYGVLEWLERERSQDIRRFWRCVFEDHIVQKYPALHLLKKSLPDTVSKFYKELLAIETLAENSGQKQKNGKNTRKRNRNDRSDDSGPSAKKPSFSPHEKGSKERIWMLSKYKTKLPVKCGDKEGILYRDKLTKGEKCIREGARGRWFSPCEFQKFAGKESSRKWKASIRCDGTPLKKLIEENHLQCPPMENRNRASVQKSKKKISISSSESSSTDSETSASSEEESDAEDVQKQSRRAGLRSQFRSRVDDDGEEEDEMVDLTVFRAPSLPVTCVSLTGTLYKDRFATGKRGKSIRTDERWFTPEEFVKEEPTLTNGLWKRDILCHGKTLNFLCKKKILDIHPNNCICMECSTDLEDLMNQNNDDVCYACHSDGDLVCCDKCPRAFHLDCHLPAVNKEDLPWQWICTICMLRTRQRGCASRNMTEQEAFDSPVSQYKLQCHYLLLCMYNEDIQRVFVKDPRQNVRRYSEFISDPMWLNRIKQKLKDNMYQTFGEFVSDFQLIFSNCRKFNRDNKFGQLGAKLKKIFEEEIQKIFFIQ